MDMFFITKIPVYILFNPCAKVTQCVCARPQLLNNTKVHQNVCNGRRSNQAYAQTLSNTLLMYTKII